MELKLSDLRYKEVINISDGSRYGYVGDVVIDGDSGSVSALITVGRLRLLGLMGREDGLTFPWGAVRQLGEDIILVESRGRKTGREK